jgi:hypothetical protein
LARSVRRRQEVEALMAEGGGINLLLRDELLVRAHRDRDARRAFACRQVEWSFVTGVDADNVRFLVPAMARHGWLGAHLANVDGAHACWLLAQHAPPARRAEWVPLMRAAVMAGNADARDFAYLEDRVAVDQNRPQTYGTQSVGYGDDPPRLWPVTGGGSLKARRAGLGMEPLPDGVIGAAWRPDELADRRGWPLYDEGRPEQGKES